MISRESKSGQARVARLDANTTRSSHKNAYSVAGFLPEDDHPTRDLLLNGKLEGSSKFVRESEDGKKSDLI